MFLSEQIFFFSKMGKILNYKTAKNEGNVKQKVKFPLCPQSIRGWGGGVHSQLPSFLISVQKEGKWSDARPGRLIPWEKPTVCSEFVTG
jgi:hypothetical protein